ncbi:MAG: hypothetical protein H7222_15515 [Methylotenera sp.]|nr:hypothetical protein [Oligoflexia bacterium]
MAALVYVLCAFTSSLCAYVLIAKYRVTRLRMLGWCGLGFVGFALNNVLLVVDLVLMPDSNLSIVRTIPALIGVSLMIWGLVWESA